MVFHEWLICRVRTWHWFPYDGKRHIKCSGPYYQQVNSNNCHPSSSNSQQCSLAPRCSEGEGKENTWYTLFVHALNFRKIGYSSNPTCNAYVLHHAHSTSAHAAPGNFGESWPWCAVQAVQVFQSVLPTLFLRWKCAISLLNLSSGLPWRLYTTDATFLCGCQPVTERAFATKPCHSSWIPSKGLLTPRSAVLCSWWALW